MLPALLRGVARECALPTVVDADEALLAALRFLSPADPALIALHTAIVGIPGSPRPVEYPRAALEWDARNRCLIITFCTRVEVAAAMALCRGTTRIARVQDDAGWVVCCACAAPAAL